MMSSFSPRRLSCALSAFAALTLIAPWVTPAAGADSFRVLVFSRTTGFRHASIADGITTIRALGTANGFEVVSTEDAGLFTDAGLAPYRVVIFLSTTGDVLNTPQQAAFQRFIRAGRGWVGIHAAADCEYGWTWYAELVGAQFLVHPAIQTATIRVDDFGHPSTGGLPAAWVRTDEWYDFRTNPRSTVHVLARLDETTYSGGTMGADHPITWYHEYDGGRAWYTACGHTAGSFAEPLYQGHLLGGIRYAAGVAVPVPAPRRFVKLVPPGATWKYRDTGGNPGTTWMQPEFNDSGWPAGRAPHGYGDGDEVTVVQSGPANNFHITTHFRHVFTVQNAAAVTELAVRLVRDDGAVVYLNGADVFRSNMPETGVIDHLTRATDSLGGNDEQAFVEKSVLPSHLREGLNVLAVEVHQNSPGSTDVSFDLSLTAAVPVPPELSLRRTGGGMELSWPAASTGFFPEKSGTLTSPIPWEQINDAPVAAGGWNRLTLPITEPRSFFRLRREVAAP